MTDPEHAAYHLTLTAIQAATVAAALALRADQGAIEWVRRNPETFGQLVNRELGRVADELRAGRMGAIRLVTPALDTSTCAP
jgi:hypothetical protein